MDKVPNTMYMYPKSIGIFPPNFTSIYMYHTENFHVGPY